MLVLLAAWSLATRRNQKSNDKVLTAAEEVADRLDTAAEKLKLAGIALCAGMHCHYSVDDETLPGLQIVKCEDCRETIGSVTLPDDVINLANAHIAEKYEAMRVTAEAAFKAEKEVKQDQAG
jgi:hypothetical protein